MNENDNPPLQPGWRESIAQRVRDSEIERQLLHARAQRFDAGAWLARFLPADVGNVLGEFLKALSGSVIGIWALAWLLCWAFDSDATLAYAGFGLLFSLQATYYKLRLVRDPAFRIPKCRCAGSAHDNSEAVLGNRLSTIVGVPISVLAAVLYVGVAVLWLGDQRAATLAAAAAAVLFSTWLAFVMIVRIRDLCSTCVAVAAVNLLLAWSVI